MDIEQVRDYCISLPFATERSPFGPDTLAMEIGGRMFCLMTLDGEWNFYNIKVDQEFAVELCGRFAGIRPGYHMNKRHWVSVDFMGDVSDSLQRKLLYHSYCQTAKKLPKKVRAELGMTESMPDDTASQDALLW